jgi:hypothetical protein
MPRLLRWETFGIPCTEDLSNLEDAASLGCNMWHPYLQVCGIIFLGLMILIDRAGLKIWGSIPLAQETRSKESS